MKSESFVAIDIGIKIVGFAYFDCVNKGFKTTGSWPRAKNQALHSLLALLNTTNTSLVVAGVPMGQDGTLTDQATDILTFCRRIARRAQGARILLIDESFSTQEAIQEVGATHQSAREKLKRSGIIDSTSAIIIGRRYLHDRAAAFPMKLSMTEEE